MCVVDNHIFVSFERSANRIQRAGHLCYRQEHNTDGKTVPYVKVNIKTVN